MPTIHFSVDSALLRELGERLIGRSHIALGELIKNSFDADATVVEVEFSANRIVVRDDGDGMTFADFENYWMRIGSPHKATAGVTGTFARRVTGSKGIGRLSTQFLAKTVTVRTSPRPGANSELRAEVDWQSAVRAGDLTRAAAEWSRGRRTKPYAGKSAHGTELVLEGLSQQWSETDYADLAREVWALQPPFRLSDNDRASGSFEIRLSSTDPDAAKRFESQMQAILGIWSARIVGRMLDPNESGKKTLRVSLEFVDGTKHSVKFHTLSQLTSLEYEIRVYSLKNRQPMGIRVEDARSYLNRYGGVHVYDGGFHLPYYGPETDWLRIEIDHSHRLSRSDLLPEQLQVAGGLSFLPTNSRLFGVVRVSTSAESSDSDSRDTLQIQASRDRLVDNAAYRDLVRLVRWSLDFYSMREAARVIKSVATPSNDDDSALDALDRVARQVRDALPADAYREIRSAIAAVKRSDEVAETEFQAQGALLGTLATAGMAAAAYQHEIGRQLRTLDSIVARVRTLSTSSGDAELIATELEAWAKRARAIRSLFSHLLDADPGTARRRLDARRVVTDAVEQIGVLTRGVQIDTEGVKPDVQLPPARYSEWLSVLQNLVTNALAATLIIDGPRVRVLTMSLSGRTQLVVEDNGSGVDMENAEELFAPFKRGKSTNEDARKLGLGGSGLGLTIVRLLCGSIGCEVKFVDPSPGWSTRVAISWKER